MHDYLSRYVPGIACRATMMALGMALLTACGGGGSGATGPEQTTESHVSAGDESANSGGHGEDPNAAHDPEGADGVHDEAAAQPHPDDTDPDDSAAP